MKTRTATAALLGAWLTLTSPSYVVRADDLLASTARQILLMRLLGYSEIPAYAHVPLVVAPNGERLAKRTRGATVRELVERGVRPETIIGRLAFGLGLVSARDDSDARPLSPREVASALTPPPTWRKTPWPIPDVWMRSGDQ